MGGPDATYDLPTTLAELTNRLVDRATTYGTEVSGRVLDHDYSTNKFSANNSMNGQKLEDLTGFKYLGAMLYKDGTRSSEVLIRITSD